jgi:hypothetical protein
VVAARQAITIGIRLSARNREVDLDAVEPEAGAQIDVATRDCFETVAATFPANWREVLRRRGQGASVREIADELSV